mmetsp:Transcript_3250/g.7514  ORF Transcript_3250/g.7514 Transcript_3250/m.7514 type:complete len:251 (+) Transcript_3250:329-1081(+)
MRPHQEDFPERPPAQHLDQLEVRDGQSAARRESGEALGLAQGQRLRRVHGGGAPLREGGAAEPQPADVYLHLQEDRYFERLGPEGYELADVGVQHHLAVLQRGLRQVEHPALLGEVQLRQVRVHAQHLLLQLAELRVALLHQPLDARPQRHVDAVHREDNPVGALLQLPTVQICRGQRVLLPRVAQREVDIVLRRRLALRALLLRRLAVQIIGAHQPGGGQAAVLLQALAAAHDLSSSLALRRRELVSPC